MTGEDILNTAAMGAADRFAIAAGGPGADLMERAGAGLAREIIQRWAPRPTLALCGPGNNGGDGFVAARHLKDAGWPVTVMSLTSIDALQGDAAWAASTWSGPVRAFQARMIEEAGLVIDALFGAGLTRPLDGEAAACAEAANASRRARGLIVAAADVPSGLDGDAARADGPVFQADLTVTFHRFKPAHVLQPGRSRCADLALVDIGIPQGWREAAQPAARINRAARWLPAAPGPSDHKHKRGRLAVLCGPAGRSGAARLAAEAGLIAGAGLVTLVCPGSSYQEAAIASRAVMTRRVSADGLAASLEALRADAAVIGPGSGVDEALREGVLTALQRGGPLVLDADALTAFEGAPGALFAHLHDDVVLTPHQGEFNRLFEDLLQAGLNKIEAARAAAERAGCVVVFKGSDTVIAAPGHTPRVNVRASASLATAGSGDVLAGVIGAFLAQRVTAFEAACAGVALQGEAGLLCGAGTTAETILAALPQALAQMRADQARADAFARLVRR